MKKTVGSLRSIVAALMALTISAAAFGQSKSLIYVHDFDQEPVTMNLNSGIGLNFGNNQWIVNDEYDGKSVYPTTPSQLVTIGTIGNIGTPNGNYLHIHDNTANTTKNTNFKSSNASVNWTDMGSGVCTYGFNTVTLVFWSVAGGDANNYGEVYYSIDGGGSWTLATNIDGDTKYHSDPTGWRYHKITDPAFNDQDNLQFAFKWTNDGSPITSEMSWGIDDVMIVGEFDPANPTGGGINAINITPNSFCHEWWGQMQFLIQIVDSMCSGTYSIEFSDSAGNFANGTTIATFNIGTPHSGFFNVAGTLPIGTFLPLGNCYKYRINRLTPPAVTGTALVGCFSIVDCPDTVSTMQPGVTMDPNYNAASACNPPGLPPGQQPVCLGSVIDVPFMSFGAFDPGNAYWLELSDSAGNFILDPNAALSIGGPSPSTRVWDPKLPYLPPPPGSQSGKIPYVDQNGDTLPEGCNYWLRVRSTDTTDTFIPWGPFCLKHCDIKTNQTIDISVCITETSGYDTLIPIDIRSFDPNFFYKNPNNYKVQLLDPGTPPAPMTIVSEGDIGVLFDTVGGQMFLSIPNLPGWLALGLQLKMYYMRIISDNPGSDTCDMNGTLIRLTVGGVGGKPLTISIAPDSVFCGSNMLISLQANVPTPTSMYLWTIDGFTNNPLPPAVTLNSSNMSSGLHWVTVQEIGPTGMCLGPLSDTIWFFIRGAPSVDIIGDFDVCVGETRTYTVEFFDATYYDWESSGGIVVEETNTEITITWNTVGLGSVQLWALGRCGEDASSKVVNILPETDPQASVVPDTIVCSGTEITLQATNLTVPLFGNSFTWYTTGDSTYVYEDTVITGISNATFTPDTSANYVVKVDYLGCDRNDTIAVEVIGAHITNDQVTVCATEGDSVLLDVWVNEDHLTSFTWEPTNGMSDPNVINPMVKPDQSTMYTLYATFDAGCPPETIQVLVTVFPVAFDYGPIPDATILRGQTVMLWAQGGTTYQWDPVDGLTNPNAASTIASPPQTTEYEVTIVDANGCTFKGPLTVNVLEKAEIFVPNVFSPNGDGSNDLFRVIDLGIEELISFKVFNRWGEVIFETSEITDGWDGTYKGEPQEVGTYVWHVEAKIISIDDEEVFQKKKGDVTLVR